MSLKINPPFRVDHVGSFLRGKEVLDTRAKLAKGEATKEELRSVEDEYIRQIVKEQLAVGIKGITDGEQRRLFFHLDFLEKFDGVTVKENTLGGDPSQYKPPLLAVTGKLRHVAPIQVDDFLFLKSLIGPETGAVPKVCIPSPTMIHFRGGRSSIDIESYPDMDIFFEDLAEAYRKEIKLLYEAGCRYLQLDDTNLAYLCDSKMREMVVSRGEDPDALSIQYCALINDCLRDVPEDLVIGIHLCRGNFRSQFFASGGYEPVANVIFNRLNVHAFFLEWDDDRSGTFEPLRHLPPNKVVVLGLVSSKWKTLEDIDKVVERIHEAAKYPPLGLQQLAVSPQCGFSSTSHGNAIQVEDQWAKMKLIGDVVKRVWG